MGLTFFAHKAIKAQLENNMSYILLVKLQGLLGGLMKLMRLVILIGTIHKKDLRNAR